MDNGIIIVLQIKFKFYIDKIDFCKNINLPIVPPNSMTQTSAGPSLPSTGILATRSIHSWMASVMCGTT